MNGFSDPRHPLLHGLPIEPQSLEHSIALESLDGRPATPAPAAWRARGSARYQLLQRAGQGGSGTVYRALDRKLDRLVAFKRFDRVASGDLRPLLREVRAAGRLSHPHIVTLYDWGADGHGPFLTFEWVEGPTLAARLADLPLPRRVALELARQIGGALWHAHTHGILHRDVKPANVLLAGPADAPRARLTDFGLAAASGSLLGGANLAGTFPYIAPEVAARGPADHRADIYSLCVTIAQMLTGVPAGTDGLPDELRAVLARGLARDPAGRFFSAGELLGALDAATGARAQTSAPPPAPRRLPATGCERRCPSCRTPVRSGRVFCPGCGIDLDRYLVLRSFLAQQQVKYLWGRSEPL